MSDQAHSSGSRFIGPNAADTFERKSSRLFNHQLPLSRGHFPNVSQRRALVRGQIFYHPKFNTAQIQQPSALADSHLRGAWWRAEESARLTNARYDYRVLSKPFWLAAPNPGSPGWQSCSCIRDWLSAHFSQSHNPVLLSERDRQTDAEVRRIFVVDDQWPIERTQR